MKPAKKITIIFSILLAGNLLSAQEMGIKKMDKLIHSIADSVVGEEGIWQIKYKETFMMIITDENYNRMRIITPIIDQSELDKDELIKLLEANYHTALDTKYALSDDILWAVFIHPLKELTENQFINAISQVYLSAATFGTTYTSTGLLFGAQEAIDPTNPSKKN
jgi:hypothetical protein